MQSSERSFESHSQSTPLLFWASQSVLGMAILLGSVRYTKRRPLHKFNNQQLHQYKLWEGFKDFRSVSIIDIFVYPTSKTNLRLRLNVLWVLSDNSVGLPTLFIHSFITCRYKFEIFMGGQHQYNIINQTLSVMKFQRTNIWKIMEM